MNKTKINSLFKKYDKTITAVAEAQTACDKLFETFIPFISDYTENNYDNWLIIDTNDGLVFSDGEILTASVTGVLKLIKQNGSVNKENIYSCRI